MLSLFVLTYEYRTTTIRKIIYQNKGIFEELVTEFLPSVDDEEVSSMLQTVLRKLTMLQCEPKEPKSPSNVTVESTTRYRIQDTQVHTY